jgi:acetyl esterase/lipase
MPSDWNGPEIKGPPSGPNQCDANMTPDISKIKNKMLDIAYASRSPSEKLDVYLPARADKPLPVIIYIHGGAFFGCDKLDGQAYPAVDGVNRGYAVVAVNYRLSPEAAWPAQINDVKAAIKFVRQNAQAYNIDPQRIALWGDSAGAHLAALAGVSADVASLEDPTLGNAGVSTRVQAVVDWFGPINFLTMDAQWKTLGIDGEKHGTIGSFESFLMRAQIGTVPQRVASANPETYITDQAPPFLIQHGDKDATVPFLQSRHFSEALIAANGRTRVTFEPLKGARHADWKYFDDPKNLDRVYRFLDGVLKP